MVGLRLILFGPPGSGKGTYAQRIAPKYNIPHIATGEIFRENIKKGTELGKLAQQYINKGQLVPDEVTIGLVEGRLKEPDAQNGFILDGYPRNIAQAEALERITKVDAVVNLNVPDDIVIARLSARRQCRKCETIYNVLFLKPKKEGVCDKDGGELYQREDDKPDAIKARLKVYESQSAPVIEYYRKKGIVKDVECKELDIPPEEMVGRILKVLNLE